MLLDTNVLSELRKARPEQQVIEHVRRIGSDGVFLSSVTIGELVYGISRLDNGAKRRALEAWLIEIERDFGDHVLPFDTETTHIWGELLARMKTAGRSISIQDAQIAATALQHGLHLMTRNVRDFEPTGAVLINPWDDSPA